MNSARIMFIAFSTIWMLLPNISCTSGTEPTGEVDTELQSLAEQSGYGEIPLIYQMSFMSRYTKKLYFSGSAENWELADIYSHEIEEIAEDIAEGDYVEEGVDIGELMRTMLLPQIESIEESIRNRNPEQFHQRYRNLIQTCNQCHSASDYGAVRVTIPEVNPYNQDFERIE